MDSKPGVDMFTGIIEETGSVKAIHRGGKSMKITVSASLIPGDLKLGDSINTNGVCLTVVAFDKESFSVDAVPETLERSSLSQLRTGSEVNLERAVRLSDRLGGHLVSGHIDGTGIIRKIWAEDNAWWLRIEAGAGLLKYMVPKGSVALEGISLTLVDVSESSFTVSVIPHTWEMTTLKSKKTGDVLNIECDIIAKYTEKLVKPGRDEGRINASFLSEHGFTE
jgi:riboflavin synthase